MVQTIWPEADLLTGRKKSCKSFNQKNGAAFLNTIKKQIICEKSCSDNFGRSLFIDQP